MLFNRIQQIPKQVFVTTKSPTSELVSDNLARTIQNNPDYKLYIFDDSSCETYIKERWGDPIYSIYRLIEENYIVAKMDLWRYLVIYDLGGIYLDDKSGPVGKFSKFIKKTDLLLLSNWNMNCDRWRKSHGHLHGEFLQWCIPAAPRHPFLRAVIAKVAKNILSAKGNEYGKYGVIKMTGPLAYTTAILDSDRDPLKNCRVLRNSFNRKMFFDATAKSSGLSKAHHNLRPEKLDYRKQKNPIVDPSRAKALKESLAFDYSTDSKQVLFAHLEKIDSSAKIFDLEALSK